MDAWAYITATWQYDEDKAVDHGGMPDANKLTIGIMALIAQNEREAISARTKAALAARKARGLPLGNPANLTPAAAALGSAAGNAFKGAKANKRAADLAPVIADIRAMGATTCAAIAGELNARGFPTPRVGARLQLRRSCC